MPVLGFYIGGVAAAAFGAVESSKFAHVLVCEAAPGEDNLYYVHTMGEISYGGDTNFGKIENKFLSYGWMSCNTQVGGVRLGSDSHGNAMPLNIASKYVEISVDSGTTFSGFNQVQTKFKVNNMDSSGNKGALVYEFDGIMNIWSGRMSSDAAIAGRLKPITGDARMEVARQVIRCSAKDL